MEELKVIISVEGIEYCALFVESIYDLKSLCDKLEKLNRENRNVLPQVKMAFLVKEIENSKCSIVRQNACMEQEYGITLMLDGTTVIEEYTYEY